MEEYSKRLSLLFPIIKYRFLGKGDPHAIRVYAAKTAFPNKAYVTDMVLKTMAKQVAYTTTRYQLLACINWDTSLSEYRRESHCQALLTEVKNCSKESAKVFFSDVFESGVGARSATAVSTFAEGCATPPMASASISWVYVDPMRYRRRTVSRSHKERTRFLVARSDELRLDQKREMARMTKLSNMQPTDPEATLKQIHRKSVVWANLGTKKPK
jgi:hypothetical protein